MEATEADTLARCVRIPLAEITKPRDGWLVYMDSWWTVTEKDEVLFYRGLSPQTNGNEATARHIQQRLYPGLRVVHVPLAFIPSHDSEHFFRKALAPLCVPSENSSS